jgi:hypothetical protein
MKQNWQYGALFNSGFTVRDFAGFLLALPFIFLIAWSERQWAKERKARGELY